MGCLSITGTLGGGGSANPSTMSGLRGECILGKRFQDHNTTATRKEKKCAYRSATAGAFSMREGHPCGRPGPKRPRACGRGRQPRCLSAREVPQRRWGSQKKPPHGLAGLGVGRGRAAWVGWAGMKRGGWWLNQRQTDPEKQCMPFPSQQERSSNFIGGHFGVGWSGLGGEVTRQGATRQEGFAQAVSGVLGAESRPRRRCERARKGSAPSRGRRGALGRG